MTGSADGVDPSQPSIARVYDYLLGGRDNYKVDRAIGDYFVRDLPGSVAIAYANRQALIRAVTAISRGGIRQFIDMGSGLPTADNVHQVAQRHAPGSRVVYVDHDPVVLAHGRALLATDSDTTVITADLRDPEKIFRHPELQHLIDFDRPVGMIFSATLHHLNNDENPAAVVRWWADRMSSGSAVYISHFLSGFNEQTYAAEQKLQATFGRGRWRSEEEILALFGDLEVEEPGLVNCSLWRPAPPPGDVAKIGLDQRELTVWEQLISCALARKR
jgi:hypothetical protein